MWGWLTVVDLLIALYFLFLFDYPVIGYLVALIFFYRILKDGWAKGDHLIIDLRNKKKNTH